MEKELKNIQKLARMLDSKQLLSHDDIAGVLTDIVNAFAQHRSASSEINKDTKETLNTMLLQLQAEHERIVGEVNNTTSSTKQDVLSQFEASRNEILDLIEELKTIIPTDGEDGKDGAPGKDGKDGSPDTRKEIVEKINSGKKDDIKIQAIQISGLPEFTREVVREVGTVGQIETRLIEGTGITITTNSSGSKVISTTGGGGTGDVVGPDSSTDNAIARYDGTTGKLLQDSSVFITDAGYLGVGTTTPNDKIGINAVDGEGITIGNTSAQGVGGAVRAFNTGGNDYGLNIIGSGFGSTNGQIKFTRTQGSLATPVESMRIDASGNVGIGTTTPAAKLSVYGGLTVGSSYAGVLDAGDNNLLFGGTIKFAGTSTHYLQVLSNPAPMIFRMWNGSVDVDALTILNNGNVGIGTTTPGNKLTVQGTLEAVGSTLLGDPSIYQPVVKFRSLYATDYSLLMGNNSEGVYLGSGHNFGLSLSANTTSAGATNQQYKVNGFASSIYLQDGIKFKVAPTGTAGGTVPFVTAMTILNSGNIGIGVTTPTASLHLGTAVSTTAGTAQLKLTLGGTVMTTPEAGAIEAINSTIYFTDSGATRRQFVLDTATQTVSAKRTQPRTASSTTASNLSPDLSSANVYYRTTQTATLTIDAVIGTPVIGEVVMFYISAAGVQTLNWNATYIPFGAALPTATVAGKTLMVSAQWNGTNWSTLTAVQV